MSTRKKTSEAPAASALSFEDAMAELEAIVEAMESEELPLGELVERYEAGTALLKQCTSALSSAKKRIELITLANAGDPDNTPGSAPAAPDETNDIRLL